ncbi:MAG TPA: choline/ethanolamine kinase family protein [bacterium]|nr:choline/ethanolamine kinase family protein [bacterium]
MTASPLGGGITNLNYRVDVNGEAFVVRIPGKESALLGIDRQREYACTVAASRSGVAPEVAHFLEPEGILVTRFIVGRGFSREEIGRPEAIRRVAESLRRIHGGPSFPGTFSPFQAVLEYLRVSRPTAPLPATVDQMLQGAETIARALGDTPRPSPCHNDLLLANFIDDGRLIRIVDWEYAAMGDPFFDLSNFAVHHEFTDAQERLLLDAYLGRAGPEHLARLKLMKILSDLREAMWAMVQVTISMLDYDYVAYGRKHFDRCARQLDDPHLSAWLSDLVPQSSSV